MEDADYVKVLAEYCRCLDLDVYYKFIADERSEHGRCICYELTVNDKVVTGVGKTKKKAKEAAAELMYNKLIDDEKERAKSKSTQKNQNPIEELIDLCQKFHLGSPRFECESEAVSSHGTMHTVNCTVLGISERVRGFRKERAKKQAAIKMFNKLKEQEKIHDNYYKLITEESKKNNSFLNPDGTVNHEEKEKFITNLWKKQFSDHVKKSKTALEMKAKDVSHIKEIEDPEGLFNRIMKEIDIPYEINFRFENDEWICSIDIAQLFFKMSTHGKEKTLAGKFTIKRVLEYMHAL